LLPRRTGGTALVAAEVRARFLRGADVLWINDAILGVRCLRHGVPAVYDVTDDWREARLPPRDRERLVAAEDVLAREVETTVCSEVLRDRWFERYGVIPAVIHNGVDVEAHARAHPRDLPGSPPHAVYVGTLHHERLDLTLVTRLAASNEVTIHLVGPDHLDDRSRGLLQQVDGINLHGRVPHTDIPQWMASADVLICPHRVDAFTLSLDAIKSFEYLASGRPVVATPTSGFQSLADQDGVAVVEQALFVQTAVAFAQTPRGVCERRVEAHDWSARTREFASALSRAKALR
jgi:glycosyltransferase involved in cell wall biosynthesis